MLNKKARPTQEDIARLAKVSQAMVSYVLNETPNVKISDETRQRVLDACSAVGYVPNDLARSLRSGRTGTIGLVIPDNSNPFFAEIARSIEDAGFSLGYSVILCNADNDVEKESVYITTLYAKQVDGIIFISSGGSHETLEKLHNSPVPIVIVDRDVSPTLVNSVVTDNLQGGYLATKHLIDLGHTEIACITGPTQIHPSYQRVEGYFKALDEAGLRVDPTFVVAGDFQIQGGEAAMNQLLGLEKKPTAVFACNDLMAIGVIQSLRKHEMKVPDDLSIVGFDDTPLMQAISPALTTIAQPISEIARIAMEMLVSRFDRDFDAKKTDSNDHITLEPILIIRRSTERLEQLDS
jgi:LacI family transcriptional regulator